MELEFMLQGQSIETLCFHYIMNDANKQRNVLVNSIVLQLAIPQNVSLFEIFESCCKIVDENRSEHNAKSMQDKQHIRNMVILLKQILSKCPQIMGNVSEENIVKMIQFLGVEALCAIAGNDSIALINLLFKKGAKYTSVCEAVQSAILSQKMCVSSYKQITRLNLFSILFNILVNKSTTQLTSAYIEKIMRVVQQEKDPRNISLVFQIYLLLLNNSNNESLMPNKAKIFECLQMYYPIDFEGDAQKHNIQLRSISALLDQCLTHKVFENQTRALLMVKMGAAPIGKYINTFCLTRMHTVSVDALTFWENLLLRTSEQEYLQEEFDQGAEFTLRDLIVQLLNRLMIDGCPVRYSSYFAITEWLQKMIVSKILNFEENSKFAGVIISTIKLIMKKCNKSVQHLIATFTVQNFLLYCKHSGDILFKLGILVPIFENKSLNFDIQNIGVSCPITQLLVLSLSQVYHQSEQNHPKLVVLKIFMLLARFPVYLGMISQTNIQHFCIEKVKQESDSKICKSYVDFLVEVYSGDIAVQEVILGCQKVDAKIYGLVTLANKVPEFCGKLTEELCPNIQNHETIVKQFISILKMLKPQSVFSTARLIPTTLSKNFYEQILKIVDEKYENLQMEMSQFISKYVINNVMLFLTRNIWRPHLTKGFIRNLIKGRIESWITESNHQFCEGITAFYNKSLDAFKITSQKIVNQLVCNSDGYKQQVYRMLPVEQGHIYSGKECKYWPTLVQYAWSQSTQVRKDLIQYLPTSILAVQGHRILPIIIPSEDVETLGKIMKNISEDVVVMQIIPFVVRFVQSVNENTEVERIVSCNKIIFDLEARSKQEVEIHESLIKNKGKILIGLEERLLQHRKRRARQSGRMLFSLLNSLK